MSASLAPECNELKERYDTCFLKWYSEKFLRNKASPPGSSSVSTASTRSSTSTSTTSRDNSASETTECDVLFSAYSKCLWRALESKGVAGMVREARKEAEETDREHMTAPGVAGRQQ